MSRRRKIILAVIGLPVLGFLILQIIPVGSIKSSLARDANPPVTQVINWDSPETERLARTACMDCHSNETVWPWYSNIAPVSWLITYDVNNGRDAMNFSNLAPEDYDLSDMEWHLYNNMPPRKYLIMHPDANLTDEQRDALMAGFRATFTSANPGDGSMEGMDMGN